MLLLPGHDPTASPATHPQLGQLLCAFKYSAKNGRSKVIVGVILAVGCGLLLIPGTEMLKPIAAIAGIIGVLMIGLGAVGLAKSGTVTNVYQAGITMTRSDQQSLLLFNNVAEAQIDYLMKSAAMNITISLATRETKVRIADGYWKSNQEILAPAFEALVNHIAISIPSNIAIQGRHNIDRAAS